MANITIDRLRERQIEGVRVYSHADKSDPFTFNRCMTHILNGICTNNEKGNPSHYDAQVFMEERIVENGPTKGQTYKVPAYKNMVRP